MYCTFLRAHGFFFFFGFLFAFFCYFFVVKMRLLHTILTTSVSPVYLYVCCAPTGLFATQNFLFHFLCAALAFCCFVITCIAVAVVVVLYCVTRSLFI